MHISRVAVVPVPANYGIHDTYVRDGLAFVFAWDTGLIIYDVGNGMRGGSPSHPVEISRLITAATSSSESSGTQRRGGSTTRSPGRTATSSSARKGPASSARGPPAISTWWMSPTSSHPAEVASLHIDGAGTHNFWMDEAKQILYAAYYNAGVVALDVSGTLSGDLSGRVLSRLQVGGGTTPSPGGCSWQTAHSTRSI